MTGESSPFGRLNLWSKVKSKGIKLLDQAVGISFENHVLAGYAFIMRYYAPGDHIYIFGFSRGAYTARFLSEMVHSIGLLSKGNEEMVRFAWETFSNFQRSRGNVPQTAKDRKLGEYMEKFKTAFCLPNVAVHFLGLFDCVNSVGQFEIPFYRKSYSYIASPSAKHIRHAVSIHERRLKFKPALFHLGKNSLDVDLKEVWFAGNHCDVGGGYMLRDGQTHLLSETPLAWMLQEVLDLGEKENAVSFTSISVSGVVRAESYFPGKPEAPGSRAFEVRKRANQPHDTLSFGGGSSHITTALWWIIGKSSQSPSLFS